MTKTPLALHLGLATDTGRQRARNEDRAYANEAAGIFLVVDGMGGHAAGEQAADTAVAVIPRELARLKGSLESRVRQAIAAANNEILAQSQTREEWAGMACVLTLAVVHDDKLVVGHVGDSRLYLAWTGRLRKLTADHSPVGEREDRGDLTEAEAMRDPLRNVVFRDVGSRRHEPFDEDFIESRSFPFRPDAAFLLSTDGLSDVLTTAEINTIVQHYDGDPQRVAEQLIEAANLAGGKDNVSVIFVAGPEFKGSEAFQAAETRARHSITRMRRGSWRKSAAGALVCLLSGIVLGAAGWVQVERFLAPRASDTPPGAVRVEPSHPDSLRDALRAAPPGTTILAAAGDYQGPLELRDRVTLEAAASGDVVTVHGLVLARDVQGARLDGIHIQVDTGNGLVIRNSTLDAAETEVSGAPDCGVRIEGASQVRLRAGLIARNRCGLLVEGSSTVRLTGNRFTENQTAIEVRVPAQISAAGNIFERNRTLLNGDGATTLDGELRQRNFILPAEGSQQVSP